MQADKDYYAILGTSPVATDEEIRLAFRQLARQLQPYADTDPEIEAQFQEVQEAYETLSNPRRRKPYDHWRSQQGFDRSSALSLHVIGSHDSLLALPDEQAYYALLSMMPMANLPTARLPLNVCVVLDRSVSMKGVRLQQVKEAINHIIDKLQPEDVFSLVVFSDRAKVLLPGQPHIDQAMAKSVVSTIQASGGTEILQGLLPGLEEIKRNQAEHTVNHLILLTDGDTYGDEQGCLEQAKWAGLNKIHLSTIGIGSDWNEDLLEQMADVSGGNSIYIDSLEKVTSIFSATMQNLETVVAREVFVKFDLSPNVWLHEAYQITPHLSSLENRDNKVNLGSLSVNQEKSMLMEFRVKDKSLGEYRLVRITVEGDMPGQVSRTWEWVELKTHFVEQLDPEAKIPSQITASLSKLAIYRMQQKVAEDLAAGRIETATQRLQLIATRLLDLGEPELSHAANVEAGQLARTSKLSADGLKKIRYGTRALTSDETSLFSTRMIG
jgi:Ca-activated chloride channel family protein